MTDALDGLKASLTDKYTIERELGQGGMATGAPAIETRFDAGFGQRFGTVSAVSPGVFLTR